MILRNQDTESNTGNASNQKQVALGGRKKEPAENPGTTLPGESPKKRPQRHPEEQYTTSSYRRAIERACARYRQHKAKQRKQSTYSNWSPNALSKSAAQRVATLLGLDAARALLGHADSTITKRHYAILDLELAVNAAKTLPNSLSEVSGQIRQPDARQWEMPNKLANFQLI
jgi:hypothetical protein